MIKRLIALLLLLLCTSAVYAEEGTILEKVESSARSWLGLIDSGKYKESWEHSASLFKAKAPEAEWVKSITAIRVPHGAMSARYIATAGATNSLSGFPDGDYVVLQFYTTFAATGLAMETVTLVKTQDETWQIAEYAIK
jgi:hypothetical protein